MNQRLYLLRISLLEILPEIWRRFVVPAEITLDRLHDVIQIVMGWSDNHLQEFTIGKNRYTEFLESNADGFECGQYRLGDLVKKKGRAVRYLYDFGDGWEHEVILEDNRYISPQFQSAIECLDGARACPPEDVGGVPGYYAFCNAMRDPDHEEYENDMNWIGGFYGSELFNVDEVNQALRKYLRWSRERCRPWQENHKNV